VDAGISGVGLHGTVARPFAAPASATDGILLVVWRADGAPSHWGRCGLGLRWRRGPVWARFGPRGPHHLRAMTAQAGQRLLLERERQRLSGVLKLAGKVGSRDGGVVAWHLVMDLVPWRSPGRHVG
jgi:hypothetical protein